MRVYSCIIVYSFLAVEAFRAGVPKTIISLEGKTATDANSMKMSDYIGLVKTDHQANFYFRIIPETKGFGLNYESVNVCGQLAQFL